MKHAHYLFAPTALILTLFFLAATAFGEESSPWSFLPARVLEIKGGAIAFQSAVIVDTRRLLENPMFQDYPTKYILPTTNESDFPIWIEVEWRVPGEEPFVSFGELKPNHYGVFYRKIKDIVWNTPISVRATIYADENKTDPLGTRDVVLQFQGGKDKELFMQTAKEVNRMATKIGAALRGKVEMPLLPGFQEMDLSKPVRGTAADKKLTEDIQLLLWKNQSRQYWDCTHEILGAQKFVPGKTAKFENLTAKDKNLIEEGLARGDISFEKWQIKSCDNVSTYLLLMGSSPTGGTDLVAIKIEENSPK